MNKILFLLLIALALILCEPAVSFFQPLFSPARLDSLKARDEYFPAYPRVGDFNEDGHLDVVNLSYSEATSEVLLGDGKGHFYRRFEFDVAFTKQSAIEDLNGDSHLDLVVVTEPDGSPPGSLVHVLLGNGTGLLSQSWVSTDLNRVMQFPNTGDFDADGKLDVAALAGESHFEQQVVIYFGNGAGDFDRSWELDLGNGWVTGFIADDFNQDDKTDIAILNDRTYQVELYLGDGSGTFANPLLSPTLYESRSLFGGHLNNDEYPDLVVEYDSFAGESYVVLFGNGDGTFLNRWLPVIDSPGPYVQIVDADSDGNADLAYYDGETLEILYGDGDTHFGERSQVERFYNHQHFWMADFLEDGIPDIYMHVGDSGTGASVTPALGDRKYGVAPRFSISGWPTSADELLSADFNEDGHRDLVTIYQDDHVGEKAIVMLFGDGTGDFSEKVFHYFEDWPPLSDIEVADFNKDGHRDIMSVGCCRSEAVALYLGDGNGGLADPTFLPQFGGTSYGWITKGDFNRDANWDLLLSDAQGREEPSTLWVLLGNGRGEFAPHGSYTSGPIARSFVIEDFNEDGHRDFVALHYTGPDWEGTGGLDLFLGDGTGAFSPGPAIPGTLVANWIGSFDSNADGHLDLVDNGGNIWLGDGNGGFEQGEGYSWLGSNGQAALADFNGDGRLDLAGPLIRNGNQCCGFGSVSLIFGGPPLPGEAGFRSNPPDGAYESIFRQSHIAFEGGDGPEAIVADDFNEDGDIDIAALNSSGYVEGNSASISLLINNTPHSWNIAAGRGTGVAPEITLFDNGKQATSKTFTAYRNSPPIGLFVSRANLDGTGLDEIITGAGMGGGAHVKAFTSRSGPYKSESRDKLVSFFAYDPPFNGGVRVTAGDLDGDGFDEIVTGPGPGSSSLVRVFDRDGRFLREFLAFDPSFTGGVYVACGDVDGDSLDEIVVGKDRGSTPDVRVFEGDGTPSGVDIRAYKATFAGGVRISCGDLNGDGADEIITAVGRGASPHVRTFRGDGSFFGVQFFAYKDGFKGGVFVAAYDLDNDGRAEIVTGAGKPGAPHVRVFDEFGNPYGVSFLAFEGSFSGGVRVAAGDWGN